MVNININIKLEYKNILMFLICEYYDILVNFFLQGVDRDRRVYQVECKFQGDRLMNLKVKIKLCFCNNFY